METSIHISDYLGCYKNPLTCLLTYSPAAGTATPLTPPAQCTSDEDHATLNYADAVQGTGQLMTWVVLGDGSSLQEDVSRALLGSGTWLPLPSSGTGLRPIRVLVRRSLNSSPSTFRFMAVSLSVLYARRVDVEVFDSEGQVIERNTVRTSLHTCIIIVYYAVKGSVYTYK